MFKKCFIASLLLPLSFTFSFADDIQETKDRINPEILELVQLKPLSDDYFDQNLYVAQFGFTYPHDNYLEIAEKVLRNNHDHLMKYTDNGQKTLEMIYFAGNIDNMKHYLKKGEESLSYKFPKEINPDSLSTCSNVLSSRCIKESIQNQKSLFPCYDVHSSHCLTETINNRVLIEEAHRLNQTLISRYKTLATDYNRVHDPISVIQTDSPSAYPVLKVLTIHHLAEAMLAFADNKAEIGLTHLLNENTQLSLYLDDKSDPLLLGVMLNTTRFGHLDHTLNQLLSAGYFDSILHDSRIEKLFLPRHEASKLAAIKALKEGYRINLAVYTARLLETPITLDDEDYLTALIWCHKYDYCYANKPNTRQQRLAKQYPELIKILNTWEEQEFKAHFTEKGLSFDQLAAHMSPAISVDDLNQHYQVLIDYFILLSGDFTDDDLIALQSKDPMTDSGSYQTYAVYLYRVEEQNNYHNLLYLKYCIKRDQIADKDIPQFLESMGELATNRITHEPFIWDAEKRELSTPIYNKMTAPVTVDFEKTKSLSVAL